MAMTLRPPVDVDRAARESAERQGMSLQAWWIEAGREKAEREVIDLDGFVAAMKADPAEEEIMRRLAE